MIVNSGIYIVKYKFYTIFLTFMLTRMNYFNIFTIINNTQLKRNTKMLTYTEMKNIADREINNYSECGGYEHIKEIIEQHIEQHQNGKLINFDNLEYFTVLNLSNEFSEHIESDDEFEEFEGYNEFVIHDYFFDHFTKIYNKIYEEVMEAKNRREEEEEKEQEMKKNKKIMNVISQLKFQELAPALRKFYEYLDYNNEPLSDEEEDDITGVMDFLYTKTMTYVEKNRKDGVNDKEALIMASARDLHRDHFVIFYGHDVSWDIAKAVVENTK